MVRRGAIILIVCLAGLVDASGQTLQSISISPAGPIQLSTGAFTTFTAMGTFSGSSTPQPIFVTWSSSNTSAVSIDNATGTATALQGTAPGSPVTITATSGTVTATTTVAVSPQTALYAVDDSDNVYVYDNTQVVTGDITINEDPAFVTSLQYQGQSTGVNKNTLGGPVPLALSRDHQYLFTANPEYALANGGDFAINAINVNTLKVAQRISNTSLCYPTSLAVGKTGSGSSEKDFLFVVDAGPSVAQSTSPASCTPNVQIYLIDENYATDSKTLLTLKATITTSQLASPTSGATIPVGNYIPLVVAASSDQTDDPADATGESGFVYVASTNQYAQDGSGLGLVSQIPVSPLADSTLPSNPVANAYPLNAGTASAGSNISPLTLTVATSYPSWNSNNTPAAVHTIFYTGPGYNTPSYSGTASFGYFSDACDSTSGSCTPYQVSTPVSIGKTLTAEPGVYTPAASNASSDGTVYAAINNSVLLLQAFAPSGTSTPAYTLGTSVGGGQVPFTGVALRADASNLFAGSYGLNGVTNKYDGSFSVLNPADLSTAFSIPNVLPLGLIVSQAPEIQLFLSQSYDPTQGGTVINPEATFFTVKGNFQNPNPNPPLYPDFSYDFPCDWGYQANGSEVVWPGTEEAASTFFRLDPGVFPGSDPVNAPPYTANGPVSITPKVEADASGNSNSIIGTTAVGQPMTMIAPTATTPANSVQLGDSNQLTVQIVNGGSSSSIANWYVGPAGAEATCPGPYPPAAGTCLFGYVDELNVYHAPPSLPASTVSICAYPNAFSTPAPGTACANTGTGSGSNTPYSNTISLTLLTPSNAGVNPTSLTFTAQSTGTTSAAQPVTLSNTGGAALDIASIVTSGDFAQTNNCGSSLAANGSCTISVTFMPTATGTRTGTLTITDNSGGTAGQTQTVSLSGTGQTPPTAGVSPPSLTFTAQNTGTTSAAQPVTLNNTGATALDIASITTSGDFAQTSNCGTSLAANGSCTISVTFMPTATGTRTGTLTITDNSGGTAGQTQTVSLSGTGQTPNTPTAGVNPPSLTFTAQNTGTTSAAQPVTLSNTGGAALAIASIVASGDFAQTNNCGSSLASNGSCTISVTFTPTATGTRTGTLTITDNTGGTAGQTQSVSLSGTGQTPNTPTAGVNPPSLTFTAQNTGTTSAAQPVTLSNTGGAALAIASIAASGDFAQTNTCGSSLAANGSCTISVTFTPTASGTRTGTLTITDNSGGTAGQTQKVSLSGTGQAPPTAAVNPPSLTFGAQNMGTTSAAQPVTLSNSGGAALAIASIAASGDFAQTNNCGSSLAANGSCTISVTFTPTATGTRTGTLTITDNSGGTAGQTQTVSLSGNGQPPVTLTVFPSSPAFEPGATQTFTALFQPASGGGPVAWTLSGSGCNGGPCGTIDKTSGLYTAPATLSAQATDTVTAQLVSDMTISGSTAVTLFLTPVVTSGQSETVTAGQSATYQLSLMGGTGDANGSLNITCFEKTLPTGVSCPSVQVQPGVNSTAFSFVVQTTGDQVSAVPSKTLVLAGVVLALPTCMFIMFGKRRTFHFQRNNLTILLFLFATACCFLIGACGTNGSFGQPAPKVFTGTPTGTYTIQLSGVEPNGTTDPNIGTVTLVVQ